MRKSTSYKCQIHRGPINQKKYALDPPPRTAMINFLPLIINKCHFHIVANLPRKSSEFPFPFELHVKCPSDPLPKCANFTSHFGIWPQFSDLAITRDENGIRWITDIWSVQFQSYCLLPNTTRRQKKSNCPRICLDEKNDCKESRLSFSV